MPDAGWALGEVVACDAAAPATWTLEETGIETYVSGAALAVEPGGVGLVSVGDEPWLVWTPPGTPPRGRPLGGGDARDLSAFPAAGVAQADLDADGATDLILPGDHLTILWGFGTEDESAFEAPITGGRFLRDAVASDFDGDGTLDMLLGYSTPNHEDLDAMHLELWRGRGGREFEVQVLDVGGLTFDLTAGDLDGDADPDLYVCNDFGTTVVPNFFLENVDGALVLHADVGLDLVVSCMGTAVGDTTHTGALDLLVAASEHTALLEGPNWVDSAGARGIPVPPPREMGWGAAVQDMDGDGRAEVVLATSDFATPSLRSYPIYWYRQAADGTFLDVGAEMGLRDAAGRGVIAHDIDKDGIPELIVGDVLRSPWVYRSNGCSPNAWLTVDGPLGSVARVTAGGVTHTALLTYDSGWASTRPSTALFGLGETDTIDRVELTPPWGDTVALEGPLEPRRNIAWTP